MKYNFKLVLLVLLAGLSVNSFGQAGIKTLKAGHEFTINIPEYMNKTTGLNKSASVQFKSTVKRVYGFVIDDTKSDLQLSELHFASIKEYCDYFLDDYVKDAEDKNVSAINTFKKGANNYMEVNVSYHNKGETFVFNDYICIIETPTSYYKVICWSSLEEKDKYQKDFQNIANSLKD